jgi:RNA polymerase sigma factor (sigma-70 family)
MTPAGRRPPDPERQRWSDSRLVTACLRGDEDAWSALIDRYKRLIFSVPLKYGLSRDDAADIFQAVCADLVTELPRIRQPKALAKWLMQAAAHRCLRMRGRLRRDDATRSPEAALADVPADDAMPEAMLREIEREQAIRTAVAGLSDRCRRMIELLFFEQPPRPYQEVAAELGLATGSIGFIRMRCLDRLRAALEKVDI